MTKQYTRQIVLKKKEVFVSLICGGCWYLWYILVIWNIQAIQFLHSVNLQTFFILFQSFNVFLMFLLILFISKYFKCILSKFWFLVYFISIAQGCNILNYFWFQDFKKFLNSLVRPRLLSRCHAWHQTYMDSNG